LRKCSVYSKSHIRPHTSWIIEHGKILHHAEGYNHTHTSTDPCVKIHYLQENWLNLRIWWRHELWSWVYSFTAECEVGWEPGQVLLLLRCSDARDEEKAKATPESSKRKLIPLAYHCVLDMDTMYTDIYICFFDCYMVFIVRWFLAQNRRRRKFIFNYTAVDAATRNSSNGHTEARDDLDFVCLPKRFDVYPAYFKLHESQLNICARKATYSCL
jgi:hypothetical protein